MSDPDKKRWKGKAKLWNETTPDSQKPVKVKRKGPAGEMKYSLENDLRPEYEDRIEESRRVARVSSLCRKNLD